MEREGGVVSLIWRVPPVGKIPPVRVSSEESGGPGGSDSQELGVFLLSKKIIEAHVFSSTETRRERKNRESKCARRGNVVENSFLAQIGKRPRKKNHTSEGKKSGKGGRETIWGWTT